MNETLKTLFSAQSRKAWGAGIVTFFTSLQLAIGEGGTLGEVTQYEWLGVAIATFGAFTATYSLGNAGKKPEPLPAIDFLDMYAHRPVEEYPIDSSGSAPATMNTVKASDV